MPASFPAACRVSVAPMMQRTDRHCRYFHRLLAPGAGLYTEMVHAQAVIHSADGRFLRHHPAERPLALQLGGSEPGVLAQAAALAVQAGFDEINLNVGCPSSRVKAGRFGACLMHEPGRVADCVRAMREAAAGRPVTVKTRIGTNHRPEFRHLLEFAEAMQDAGVAALAVHARIAVLEGLSPKENRNVPPLKYGTVYRLKEALPDLPVVLNGGIASAAEISAHLQRVDGVMLGRAAYANPWLLAELPVASGRAGADAAAFASATSAPRHSAPKPSAPEPSPPTPSPRTRAEVLQAMVQYAQHDGQRGVPLGAIARHMAGLYAGQPGAAAWRRAIARHASAPASEAPALLACAPAPLRHAA